MIFRSDLKNNPKLTYVFGDNLSRVGFGGQAKEMRGEPNAFGIATKKSTYECFNESDEDFALAKKEFYEKFLELKKILDYGLIIVWPEDGIGTGLADLPRKAPRIWRLLNTEIFSLEQYDKKL